MRLRALALAAVLGATALVGAGQAQAKTETKTLTFKVDLTSQGTTLHNLPGDITYGWNHLTGPTKWGGKKADLEFLGNVDYVSGTGPFGGYVTVTRSDGTQLAWSVSGWATAPSDQAGTANAKFAGTLTVIGGSNAYEGAVGTGSMTGYRKSALGSPVQLTFTVTVERPKS